MSPNKGIFLIAIFALSVSCCLMAVGAFVLLTTAAASPQSISTNSEISQQIKNQEDISKILKDKIAQINERISRLQNKSEPDEGRVKVARKIKETIDYLKSVTSNLHEKIPLLCQKLAEIQAGAQQLDVLDADANPKKEATKNSAQSQQLHTYLNLVDVNRKLNIARTEGIRL